MRYDITGARGGRPLAVWSLALLLGVGALLCAIGALAPPSEGTPVVLDAVFAVVGAGLAAVLWRTAGRTPRWLLHLGVGVALVATTSLVAAAATGEGAVSAAVTYVWLAVYAAIALSTPARRVVVATSVVGLGAGLALSVGTLNAVMAWVVVSTSCVVASEVLGDQHRQLRALATTDPLTGALNRTGLTPVVDREIAGARRRGMSLALAVIDLDGFKVVNDRDGHAAGDALLAAVTAHWRTQLRPGDTVARTGGDEFVLLLPGTGAAGAERLLGRLRRDGPARWTAGVAELEDGDDLDVLLARADAAMYRRKVERDAPSSPDIVVR